MVGEGIGWEVEVGLFRGQGQVEDMIMTVIGEEDLQTKEEGKEVQVAELVQVEVQVQEVQC